MSGSACIRLTAIPVIRKCGALVRAPPGMMSLSLEA
jgi:hypothetical protein